MATFQPVTGLLARLGDDHHVYGDPYTATCVIVALPGQYGCCTVVGLSGKINGRLVRGMMQQFMNEYGYRITEWERSKSGVMLPRSYK